jgi:hypothetical protein
MKKFRFLFVPLLLLFCLSLVIGQESSFNLPRQFSSTQGSNNWFYYYGTPTSQGPLSWSNYVDPWGTLPRYDWNGGARFLEIAGRDLADWKQIGTGGCSGWLQPGENMDISIVWQAPATGTVYISAMLNTTSPVANASGGNDDGVNFFVYNGSTIAGQVRVFRGNDEDSRIGHANITTSVNINTGELIYFYVNRGNWQDSDGMFYSFTVSYDSLADLAAPVSSHDVQGNQMQLFAEDTQSGVAVLEYQKYYPDGTEWIPYTGPITLPAGESKYMYRAIDSMGNVEPYNRITVYVEAPPPSIAISPNSFEVYLRQGSTTNQTMTINNNGGSQLNWQFGEPTKQALTKLSSLYRPVNAVKSIKNSNWSKSSTPAGGGSVSTRTPSVKKNLKISDSMPTEGRILLLASEGGNDFSAVETMLVNTGMFTYDEIDMLNNPSTLTLTDLQPYSAVLVWTDYNFTYPSMIGDALKQFVDAGGGVVLSTYCFTTDWAIQGGILDANYSPFLPASTQSVSGTLDMSSITDAGHPIFAGIVNAPTYWWNEHYSNPSLNTGGRLLAKDTYGNNLLAENPNGKVVALNFWPNYTYGEGYGTTNTETIKLLTNAILYVEGGGRWFNVTPQSGTIDPGMSQEVSVNFRTLNLGVGTYADSIIISSDDPVNSIVPVPVTLNVLERKFWITGFVGDNSYDNPTKINSPQFSGRTPLPGVVVHVNFEGEEPLTTETDIDGNFAIELAHSGGYMVKFTKPGYVPMWCVGNEGTSQLVWDSSPVNVGVNTYPDSISGLYVYLSQGGMIDGKIALAGVGIPGSVMIHSTQESYVIEENIKSPGKIIDKLRTQFADMRYPVLYACKTDPEGNYHMTVLPGQYFVSFHADPPLDKFMFYNLKKVPPYDTVTVLSITDIVHNIDADFAPRRTVITGHLVDAMENPISDATVVALSYTEDTKQMFAQKTDQNGFYDLPVSEGRYKIGFGKSGYIQEWWAGEMGQVHNPWDGEYVNVGEIFFAQDSVPNINGMLERGGIISGRTTEYNEPVQSDVYVWNPNDDETYYYTHTQPNGEYELAVPPGNWHVEFEKDEFTVYGPWTREWIVYNQKNEPPFDTVKIFNIEDILNGINGDYGLPPEQQPIRIKTVVDVPEDNGRQVWVVWNMFELEGPIYNDSYRIKTNKYTMLPAAKRTRIKSLKITEDYSFTVLRKDRIKDYTGNYITSWTQVGVPYKLDYSPVYSLVVPTLFDSTKSKGIVWSKFRVNFYGYNPFPLYSTAPDSGYSVNDWEPTPPTNLMTSIKGNDIIISWNAPVDYENPERNADVVAYKIYRGTTSDFDPSEENLLGTVIGKNVTTFTVKDGVAEPSYIYKITAMDNSENESMAVKVGGTGVADIAMMPTQFAVHQNYPNPFNPATTISYDLPNERFVTLRVYNTLGQEVAALVNTQQPAGRYSVSFDAKHLASGIYVYRLTAGADVSIKKMSLIK